MSNHPFEKYYEKEILKAFGSKRYLEKWIEEIGNPFFSIVENGSDEHPDKNVIRISDCKFDVFIDVSCFGDRKDALERAQALCRVLNIVCEARDEAMGKYFASNIQLVEKESL